MDSEGKLAGFGRSMGAIAARQDNKPRATWPIRMAAQKYIAKHAPACFVRPQSDRYGIVHAGWKDHARHEGSGHAPPTAVDPADDE